MSINVIISGGGTGGHIYPAIAIANAIKKVDKEANVSFVGAVGKMEMEKVPEAGYEIIGLPVRGIQRKLTLKNIVTLFRLFSSLVKSRRIINKKKPDVVVGVGGYASGPLCYMASKKRIPIVLQEQNSYPGITNKLLASKASKICVAYEKMERFFSKDKLVITGNPVRQDILDIKSKKQEGIEFYNLDPEKKTIVIVGGSLGARTLNESVLNCLEQIRENKDVQIIWQTGSYYYNEMQARCDINKYPSLKMMSFLSRMDLIYAVADVIISRAGACTISELCLTSSATILVPSPNVSEDHQTKNARALSDKDAALLIPDKEAKTKLIPEALKLVKDKKRISSLSQNISNFAYYNSADVIAEEIYKIVNK
jgi:UDP-N-acetylglucosamine--N-acetylmuramyl-(pentapeptide) pyrophosphoryl-undecaprenol N-acetylglucosamine transferase